MWHFIRFAIIWIILNELLYHYGVPIEGALIILLTVWLYGINEIYDCYVRWAKWDE